MHQKMNYLDILLIQQLKNCFAEFGTSETSEAPIKGFIFSFKNRFINFANKIPHMIAKAKDITPDTEMTTDFSANKNISLYTGTIT